MQTESKLVEFNPHLSEENGVFRDSRDRFRESSLSNNVRIEVADIYAATSDTGLYSTAVEKLASVDEVRAEMDPARFSFLLSINFEKTADVLDLTQDLGGVACFLSEHAEHVDSVKIDRDRGRLSALRCESRSNVAFVTEDLNELVFPKQHYDLVVIGNLEELALDHDQTVTLLANLRDALSATGTIIINAPNSGAIRQQFDANANSPIPFEALYQDNSEIQDREGLEQAITEAGLSASQFYASFSQSDRISNLFSDDYLGNLPTALNHFYRLGAISNPLINEYPLFRKLSAEQPLIDLASRFVVLAGSNLDSLNACMPVDFAHYPGQGRRPEWRTTTQKPKGQAVVQKVRVLDLEPSSELLTQRLDEQEYVEGRLLVVDWLDAALQCDRSAFLACTDNYLDYLSLKKTSLGDEAFSMLAYDLLPFNIVVPLDGAEEGSENWSVIDPEWQLNKQFDEHFVLFRALLWFAFENKPLLEHFCVQENIPTLAHFIVHWHPGLATIDDLTGYIELEEQVQSEIDASFRSGSVANVMQQSFSVTNLGASSSDAPMCQLQWSDENQNCDTANAQFAKWSAEDSQTVVLTVPEARSDMPLLRIDPMASKGLFSIQSLTLTDDSGTELYAIANPSDCLSSAELVNIEVADDGETCIAINEDPYLLFDFTDHVELKDVHQCELTLAVEHTPAQLSALSTLLDRMDAQTRLLSAQSNRLNEYKAEMEFNRVQLQLAQDHREDLNAMINEHNRRQRPIHSMQDVFERTNEQLRRTIRDQNHKLKHLNEQLLDQIRHNHSVDQYLMQRPSTRIKGFLARVLRRVTGRTAPAQATTQQDAAADEKPGGVVEQLEATTPTTAEAEVAALTNEAQPNSGLASDDVEADASSGEAEDAQKESDKPEPEPELLGQNKEDYQLWIQQNSLSEKDIQKAKLEIETFEKKPVFSVLVPVYNTDEAYLIPMIRSVQAQIYPHWELILVDDCSPKEHLRPLLEKEAADDPRIKIKLSEVNQGIALTSNEALALATGDYVALLDHDDELSIDALYENAKVINQRPDVGLIYSDEDKMDLEGNRLEPFFKPDYSPDLLDTNNYVCHLTVMKKAVVDRIGGFREGFDGSQDHDIILRAIAESQQVVHIPKILYHWRKIPGSTAVTYDSKSYAWEAGRQAVEDCVQERELKAHVEFGNLKGTYRVFRQIRGEPLVSIIIPFRDKPELLSACVRSIMDKTEYKNFEVVGVNNGSSNPETHALMKALSAKYPQVRFVDKDIPFNFSAICNYGVEQAKGEYVLLLNNDIIVDGADWLERLLEHAQRPHVGAVGGKLLYPDGRIQHAGIVIGMVGAAGHPHKYFPDNHIGYHGRLHMVYNVSAVTGAMLMVSKKKFLEVGGLNQEHLAVAYNDVDFCLKLMEAGYSNIFTPHARAIHHESVSRGYEDTPEKLERLKAEQKYFLTTWADFLERGDPYYSPNLSLLNESFSLKFDEEKKAT